ncbi:MAG: chemotaxis protein CheW [Candidatus Rifleibacteriota bacterium]
MPSAIELLLKTELTREEIEALLEFLVKDQALYDVTPAANLPVSPINPLVTPKIGKILLEKGEITEEQLEKSLSKQKRIGEHLVDEGLISREKLDEALKDQNRQRVKIEALKKADISANIKVNAGKLDKLFDLIGELVTVQERLSQASSVIRKTHPEDLGRVIGELDLEAISEEISMLTNSLRDNALSVRMLPIEATFSKFRRLIHDLSAELHKSIELTMSGTETEIDKTVIDKLDEPLMHIIRNCADHGIESPEDRRKAGKPVKGNIHLSAEHVAGNVVIHIRDDGAGLNRKRIFEIALQRGLISEDTVLTDGQVYNLIFEPGFSTAKNVTSISGRGVGMDVVKKTIESLGGNVNVLSTEGKGTQIDITLPLTLAIIDGLLVSISHQSFVFPLNVVNECVELRRGNTIDQRTGGNLANVRGALIPYIRLRDLFDFSGEAPEIEQIVISSLNGRVIGFVVDEVIGGHKTVIKPIGKMYKTVPEFSGASILGDGSIAIIVDLFRILKISEAAEALKN